MHWIYLIHEFHNLSWITEINELFHNILIEMHLYICICIYIYIYIYIYTYTLTWQQLNAFRHLDVKTTFKPSIRTGKKGDLSDFERGMVVGVRRAGLSISKIADLLGFSRISISRVYREWSEKEKISSERQLCGWTCLCWCQRSEEKGQTG